MMVIDSANRISIDDKPTGLAVTQASERTVVYTPENAFKGQQYREHEMPRKRYSLSHDRPASGVSGRGQFEKDIRDLVAKLKIFA